MMTELNRWILVCCLILRWYHKALLSELKAPESLLMHASTIAVRLQLSLMLLPKYSKLDTTSIGSESRCSVMDSSFGYSYSSVSPCRRTAMVLVVFVLKC